MAESNVHSIYVGEQIFLSVLQQPKVQGVRRAPGQDKIVPALFLVPAPAKAHKHALAEVHTQDPHDMRA